MEPEEEKEELDEENLKNKTMFVMEDEKETGKLRLFVTYSILIVYSNYVTNMLDFLFVYNVIFFNNKLFKSVKLIYNKLRRTAK